MTLYHGWTEPPEQTAERWQRIMEAYRKSIDLDDLDMTWEDYKQACHDDWDLTTEELRHG